MSCYILYVKCEEPSAVSGLEAGRADVRIDTFPQLHLRVPTDDIGDVSTFCETGKVSLSACGMHSVDACAHDVGVVGIAHDDVISHTVLTSSRTFCMLNVEHSSLSSISARQAAGCTVKASKVCTVRRSKNRRRLLDSLLRRLKDSLGRYILDKRNTN